jgi:hypothetical protein
MPATEKRGLVQQNMPWTRSLAYLPERFAVSRASGTQNPVNTHQNMQNSLHRVYASDLRLMAKLSASALAAYWQHAMPPEGSLPL